jgi:riboflavin kinase / FMN adenylyltransferase
MDLVRGLAALPADAAPSAVTVGFFDGVHRGHQAVFRRVVEVARSDGLIPVAVTFDRHPREILTPGREPGLLTTLERKAALVADMGVERLVVLEFTEDFSRWPADAFVRRILVEGLRARRAVVGANFTFGYRALGTFEVLADLGAGFGIRAEGVSLLQIDGRTVSSSSIREALSNGDLAWPQRALGRRYVVDGRVVEGAGRGAGLGWPTANLLVPPRMLLPADGVYAGMAHLPEDRAYAAAINVGTNPTFGREPLHAEAYLLDFDGDLRGSGISLEFWARLRDEVAFGSPEELARQIEDDVRRTRELVSGSPAPR